MVKHGFLRLLVQFHKMAEYWNQMLKEYPDHPAGNMVRSSAPLSLYGALMGIRFKTTGPKTSKNFFGFSANISTIYFVSGFKFND